jgi:hypothetical protein
MKATMIGAGTGLVVGVLLVLGLRLASGDSYEIGDSFVGMAIVGTGLGSMAGALVWLLRPAK